MKIVLAPDKFKGSLTGIQFCDAVAEGIQSIFPQAEILKMPLADGGDGTIGILNYHLQGEKIELKVNNPLFKPVNASYLYIKSLATAYIEMAEASGMNLLNIEEQNCMFTTTYGTGELILNAIQKGVKNIILGIGGSATNDCGIGMAAALGYKFFDSNGKEIMPIGKNLALINSIDSTSVNTALKNITIKVACDVANPLYGSDGAAFVYASQKGATEEEVILLDKGLEHIATIINNQFKVDLQKVKGAGAAGGMGAGALVFLNAELLSGIDLIKELIDFDTKIKGADWIITGEGKLDSQTLSGKTIHGVIASAKKYNIPVAALCGNISLTKEVVQNLGITYATSILERAKTIDDAMENSYTYLLGLATDFAKNGFILLFIFFI
jgi:glycerate kinase